MTLIVVGIAHCPGFGVNVNGKVPATAVLTVAFQTPTIAGRLVELKGRTGDTPPWHTLGIAAKVGTICVVIFTVMVVVVAHCPAAGVNVYTVLPRLVVLMAAFHVPVIAGRSFELVGKAGATEF